MHKTTNRSSRIRLGIKGSRLDTEEGCSEEYDGLQHSGKVGEFSEELNDQYRIKNSFILIVI